MASERIRKINGLILHELGTILQREDIVPPEMMITLTQVDTSADLSYADIRYSILPTDREPEAARILERHTKELRSLLARAVILRKVPELRFHIDTTEAHAAHIDALIDKIHQEE